MARPAIHRRRSWIVKVKTRFIRVKYCFALRALRRSQPDNAVAAATAGWAGANKPKKGGGGVGAEFSPPPLFLARMSQ